MVSKDARRIALTAACPRHQPRRLACVPRRRLVFGRPWSSLVALASSTVLRRGRDGEAAAPFTLPDASGRSMTLRELPRPDRDPRLHCRWCSPAAPPCRSCERLAATLRRPRHHRRDRHDRRRSSAMPIASSPTSSPTQRYTSSTMRRADARPLGASGSADALRARPPRRRTARSKRLRRGSRRRDRGHGHTSPRSRPHVRRALTRASTSSLNVPHAVASERSWRNRTTTSSSTIP